MKIRLFADLIIDPTETILINQIRDFLIANQPKFLKIDSNNSSSIIVEKCHHDEQPAKPCEVILQWQKQ